MRALDEAEARLGCALPKAFRLNYATRPVLTKVERWEIREPNGFIRTRRRRASDQDALPNVDGVVVGGDVGGASLLLHFDATGGALEETLWSWERGADGGEKVALHLGELIDDSEPGAMAVPDFVCAFCGSEQLRRSHCSVCGRSTDETRGAAEVDAHALRASRLIAALIKSGDLELTAASSAQSVIERTGNLLAAAEGKDDAEVSGLLLEEWERSDAVAEIYVDDAELVTALRASVR